MGRGGEFGGRSAGWCFAWLKAGSSPTCDSKVNHFAIVPSKADRRAGRDIMKESPICRQILSKELPKRNPEDDSEPD